MTLEHDPGTDTLVERLVRAGRADGPSAKALAAAPAAVTTLLSGQAAAAGLTPALGAVAPAGKVAASPLVLLTWVALSAGVTAAATLIALPCRMTIRLPPPGVHDVVVVPSSQSRDTAGTER